jgi:hypothetical protein
VRPPTVWTRTVTRGNPATAAKKKKDSDKN